MVLAIVRLVVQAAGWSLWHGVDVVVLDLGVSALLQLLAQPALMLGSSQHTTPVTAPTLLGCGHVAIVGLRVFLSLGNVGRLFQLFDFFLDGLLPLLVRPCDLFAVVVAAFAFADILVVAGGHELVRLFLL